MRLATFFFMLVWGFSALDAVAQGCDPATKALTPNASGQIIILDPATGRPTSDASKAPVQALSPAELARYNQAFDDLVIVVHPDGSESVDLTALPQTPQAAELVDGELVTCHVVDVPETSR